MTRPLTVFLDRALCSCQSRVVPSLRLQGSLPKEVAQASSTSRAYALWSTSAPQHFRAAMFEGWRGWVAASICKDWFPGAPVFDILCSLCHVRSHVRERMKMLLAAIPVGGQGISLVSPLVSRFLVPDLEDFLGTVCSQLC